MKKWWAKLLVIAGGIGVGFFLWLANSGVHSKNAVDRYKDQLRAAGEELDLDKRIPSHVDPRKNGASLFLDASRSLDSYAGPLSTNSPAGMLFMEPGRARIQSRQTEVVSIYSELVTNSWTEIEQALKTQASGLDLVRQAAERPQINFEIVYPEAAALLLPHLSKMKETALLLSVAALDSLHRDDSFQAATNIHITLSLVNAWKEPLLYSHMLRMAMAYIAVSAQWEFLQSTNLTDPQLELLQRDWMKLDFLHSAEIALVMERNRMCLGIEHLRTSNSPSAALYDSGSTSPSPPSGDWWEQVKDLGDSAKTKTADVFWRASWSYSDELMSLKGNQVLVETMRQIQADGYFKDALDDQKRRLAALGAGSKGSNWFRNQLNDQLETLGIHLSESVAHIFTRILNMEAARRMTITAIALRRYQLRHGVPPPDLNSLIPEFLPALPRDPVDGKPLRYQATPDGSFLLYSIGKDNLDDGGDPRPDGLVKGWFQGRDLVWPQAATDQEIKFYYDNLPK